MKGKLNQTLRDIVELDKIKDELIALPVVHLDDMRRIKADRSRLVITLQTAPR